MLLEEEIQGLLDAGRCGAVFIVGPPGSGKTMALSHLAAVLPPESGWTLLDNPTAAKLAESSKCGLCVAGSEYTTGIRSLIGSYRLAPWTRDDVIEYLLVVHREQCASVIARLRPADLAFVGGLPVLCRFVCDEFAGDETITDVATALRRYIKTVVTDERLLRRACDACLASIALRRPGLLVAEDFPVNLGRMLRHRPVQLLLAAEGLADLLRGTKKPKFLYGRFPRDLVQRAAEEIRGDSRALDSLCRLLTRSRGYQPMAASILHFAGALPATLGRKPLLRGAYLDGIIWPNVRLISADCREADLSGADLRNADLTKSVLDDASLAGAQLNGAVLTRISACRTDLSRADLSGVTAEQAFFDAANLTNAKLEGARLCGASLSCVTLEGASFRGSDLSRATLTEAKLPGADFTNVTLDGAHLVRLRLRSAEFGGASFAGAFLAGCDLEDMQLPAADFSRADLQGAWLSGSVMHGADFTYADLRNAGLAEIDWEGASLRKADLRGATFHMGGARSGLVMSPIACEGSRTGFYTDELEEQHFKSPEEIRKANLCSVDLRGALIDGVDFYLVDLRGARYNAEQERHLRKSGAILEARCM